MPIMEHSGMKKVKSAISSAFSCFFSSSWPSAILIFLTSFWIRYQKLLKIPRRWLAPDPSRELDSIAISLVNTGQFADPYMIQTGPTAHLPPIPPWLASQIYKLFGLTEQGGFYRYLFLILMAAAMFALLPWLGEKLGLGRPAGLMGGMIGAFSSEWAGHGEFLTGIGLTLLLFIFLSRWRSEDTSWWSSILVGLFGGLLFHIQPALILVVLGCLVFELWWSKSKSKVLSMGLILAGILFACLPWGWRNYQTLGGIIFIRSNFGLELRLGNHENAEATWEIMDQNEEEHHHPRTHFSEVKLIRDMGELEYMRLAKGEALDWIRNNPGRFAQLSFERFINLWFGPPYDLRQAWKVTTLSILAAIGIGSCFGGLSPPQRALVLIPLLTYPLVYYIVAYMPRYRIPIDGLIYLLAGGGIVYVIQILNNLIDKSINSSLILTTFIP